MRLQYLGDSFDIVKQSLLRWLSAHGPWSAHPMFTDEVCSWHVEAFSRLLGVPIISAERLAAETDRSSYFATARRCDTHLFLDPDTGLRLDGKSGKGAESYLFAEELAAIAKSRPALLTLVFDQSVARGKERQQLEGKLRWLEADKVHGAAYVSHACFLLVGCDRRLVKKAVQAVREGSGLPCSRFIGEGAAEQADAADGALM